MPSLARSSARVSQPWTVWAVGSQRGSLFPPEVWSRHSQ